MLILTYCAVDEGSIEGNLGVSEYSYYFVYKRFKKILDAISGHAVQRCNLEELDRIYFDSLSRHEECICLFFSAPHNIPAGLKCPVVPVFAWEFDRLPEGILGGLKNDWGYQLAKTGWAITHSNYTKSSVQASITGDYPIAVMPSPVWDDFKSLHAKPTRAVNSAAVLRGCGKILDTEQGSLAIHEFDGELEYSGVAYLSVFNPHDLRKNWDDLVKAFCFAFKGEAKATLILKLTHTDCEQFFKQLARDLERMGEFDCRVIAVQAYLDSQSYFDLIENAHYVVNSSIGEGQCLPLMEGMSAGKPAITPNHTSMLDYVSQTNSFVVNSGVEPGYWPHDPRQSYRTLSYRIHWDSLCDAFSRSFECFVTDSSAYREMSVDAYMTMKGHCSESIIKSKLSNFLSKRLGHYRSFNEEWSLLELSYKHKLKRFLRPLKRRLVKGFTKRGQQ